eukprot:CAMPEP_0119305578 /NCGR_PEP_ID=MMETSP1333-20130426/6545_1 /TAXON_ID=418940 /ORGANISM="Scyphosphaera apsteinii, Strain RCC1455" /LENGTH=163 /DNA_ID=CAMNT_0007308703 /DNA_START=28 /DNA_END=519 /DNA_ORIENTATION=+
MSDDLLPDWEAVVDREGRTYWWNVTTNETTWTKPVAIKTITRTNVAAGYLAKVHNATDKSQGASSQQGGPDRLIRSGSDVSALTQCFGALAASTENSASSARQSRSDSTKTKPPSPSVTPAQSFAEGQPASLQRAGSSRGALSVSAMKKYQEAKALMRQQDVL